MFFSTELLTKRDGGFGLLWLAATLGPKSSFSKLPKRSVLNADITELCDLIAQPKEPLSLRLSSNLMVGAARVYRVKHDIFLADVNSCFANLKKAVQDMRAAATTAALEMHNPVARPEVLNVSDDPGMGRAALEIDFFAPTWDEWITRAVEDLTIEEGDEYDPSKSKAAKARAKQMPNVAADIGAHTLQEPHQHLLGNASIDLLDSSQPSGFNLDTSHDDPIFDLGGGDAGLGNMDLDLGLDLGADWDYPVQHLDAHQAGVPLDDMVQMDIDFPAIDGMDIDIDLRDPPLQVPDHSTIFGNIQSSGHKRPRLDDAEKEENAMELSPAAGNTTPRSILLTPTRRRNNQHADGDGVQSPRAPKKGVKTVRVLLDPRIELSNEEMKSAREKYVEEQNKLRQAELAKRHEKDSMRRIEDMMWAPPETFRAPELLQFWNNTFKIQVETRSGVVHIDRSGNDMPRSKRRRVDKDGPVEFPMFDDREFMGDDFGGLGMETDVERMRSELGIRASATPEVARHGSKPPSLTGSGVGIDADDIQRDREPASLFPWGNAAGFTSSSIQGGNASVGLRTPSVDEMDVGRLSGGRSRSRSGRLDSPTMHSSLREPRVLGIADIGRSAVDAFDDFQLDLDGNVGGLTQSQSESQNLSASQSLAALEKTANGFLMYAKQHFVARAAGTTSIKFEKIVPEGDPLRNAANAFYNCLLLATKNLITVNQEEPYGPIDITIL